MEETQDEHFTSEELENIEKLRDMFHGKLPSDLDTELNLRRWMRGWKGNLNEIEPRLKDFIQNRKLMRFDSDDFLKTFESHPVYKNYFKYFAFSLVDKPHINTKDNTIFACERLENVNFNSITSKVANCGDFVNITFLIQEAFFRHVLRQEKLTGKPSGVSVIYDMQGFNILEYANPNSAIIKVSKACFLLLQDYYCEVLTQIYIVNAPRLMGLFWELMKLFIAPTTQRKIEILGSNYKEILQKRIDLDILPVHYGGNRRDTSGRVDPDTCCNIPAFIPNDYKRLTNKCSDFTTVHIKPNSMFEVRKTVNITPTTLIWKFFVNSDIEFGVVKENSCKLSENSKNFLAITESKIN